MDKDNLGLRLIRGGKDDSIPVSGYGDIVKTSKHLIDQILLHDGYNIDCDLDFRILEDSIFDTDNILDHMSDVAERFLGIERKYLRLKSEKYDRNKYLISLIIEVDEKRSLVEGWGGISLYFNIRGENKSRQNLNTSIGVAYFPVGADEKDMKDYPKEDLLRFREGDWYQKS
ncbi:MAG: hypothetical protein PHS92_02835 [Candidatus Gracilibacteria bacterium]|nr:hypothetical protein [Candidatus Gracilibacteria bacterium]